MALEKKEIEQVVVETLRRGVHFGVRDVQPATNLYLALEDRLRILVFNSVAGVEVDFTARLQMPDGQVIPYVRQLFPTSNRASNTFEQDMAEGFLLDISISTPTAAVRAGACYVLVQIIRGTGANAIVVRSLLANYLTTGLSIGWPEGPSGGSVQGTGLIRSVQVGNPAAGADWITTVPTGARWLVQAVFARFLADANVATRQIVLQIKDASANKLVELPGAFAPTAGQGQNYVYLGGVNNNTGIGDSVQPLPDVASYLQGFTIGTATTSIQVGDQWSQISLFVQEWIEQ